MASESCTSIIEWLSDVEADTSAYWEQSLLQDASLTSVTFSPHHPPLPPHPALSTYNTLANASITEIGLISTLKTHTFLVSH